MTYRGIVKNGMIVLEGEHPPEGARVEVREMEREETIPTLAETLGDLIGCANDLPEDMAEQHNHYIHGTPKR